MRSPETLRLLRARRGRLVASALLAVGVAALSGHSRAVVSGHSMAPTLLPGDRLVVRRGRGARPGDLVVVRGPGGIEAVKRLAGRAGDLVDLGPRRVRLGAGEVAVLGDCPAASTDSRQWGPLPEGAVRGRVLATYHPPERARRWPGAAAARAVRRPPGPR